MKSGRTMRFGDGVDERLSDDDGIHRERSSAAGVGRGSRHMRMDDFLLDDFGEASEREVKRERTAPLETRTTVVFEKKRVGSAPPVLQRRLDREDHESSSEEDMDDVFDIRVQTLTDGVVNTKDLRCVSCFVRYADVAVFPCGHVCT